MMTTIKDMAIRVYLFFVIVFIGLLLWRVLTGQFVEAMHMFRPFG